MLSSFVSPLLFLTRVMQGAGTLVLDEIRVQNCVFHWFMAWWGFVFTTALPFRNLGKERGGGDQFILGVMLPPPQDWEPGLRFFFSLSFESSVSFSPFVGKYERNERADTHTQNKEKKKP